MRFRRVSTLVDGNRIADERRKQAVSEQQPADTSSRGKVLITDTKSVTRSSKRLAEECTAENQSGRTKRRRLEEGAIRTSVIGPLSSSMCTQRSSAARHPALCQPAKREGGPRNVACPSAAAAANDPSPASQHPKPPAKLGLVRKAKAKPKTLPPTTEPQLPPVTLAEGELIDKIKGIGELFSTAGAELQALLDTTCEQRNLALDTYDQVCGERDRVNRIRTYLNLWSGRMISDEAILHGEGLVYDDEE